MLPAILIQAPASLVLVSNYLNSDSPKTLARNTTLRSLHVKASSIGIDDVRSFWLNTTLSSPGWSGHLLRMTAPKALETEATNSSFFESWSNTITDDGVKDS